MLHTDLPARGDIEKLVAIRGEPAVSIYLRTTPVTQQAQSNRIELKNLLKAAIVEMEAAGIAKRSILAIETDVEALIEDDEVWAHQANSLAIFLTPERVYTYRLANHVTNLVEVSDRFHIKPLLRAVTFPHIAYVLAISMGAVRLVEVTAEGAPVQLHVHGLPKDMADALGRRSHLERAGDMRSAGDSSENALLARYSRAVDRALRPVLTGRHRPLIVAAAEPLASAFRHVCSYHNVAAQVIPGSADHTPDHELGVAARGVLDEIYAGEIAAFTELYAERASQARATGDIAQAARAATFGAIDTLLVDMDAVISGSIDENGAVTFDESADGVNYGVVDEIVRRALGTGATVRAVRANEIPGDGALAAILRYAF